MSEEQEKRHGEVLARLLENAERRHDEGYLAGLNEALRLCLNLNTENKRSIKLAMEAIVARIKEFSASADKRRDKET